jgi:glycosyltransferase involved in cell wall biosynthesis
MASGPQVLFLTHEPPLPMISGTRVRSLNLIRELARRGWRPSLFSLVPGTSPSPGDRLELEELCEGVALESLPSTRARRLSVGLAIARGRAFHQAYFFSAAAAERLHRLLESAPPDVIVAEQLYMYPYVPEAFHDRTVLDCHNVELRRLETMAAALWPRPRAIAARLQRRPVDRLERSAVAKVAGVLAVSEPERRHFEPLAGGEVTLVPNGVDCERWRPRAELPAEPSLLFTGSLNYSANLDAARYLIEEILPHVRRRDAAVTIVGGDAPRDLCREAERSRHRIAFPGVVTSTEPFFAGSRFMVVPLRFGAGTPFKVLESLARGVPVLSTGIGCQGFELTPGRDVLIADRPEEFAAEIDRLLEDDELCEGLGRNGREVAERLYDWRRVGDGLERALSAAVSRWT